jgi:hypothetical protein
MKPVKRRGRPPKALTTASMKRIKKVAGELEVMETAIVKPPMKALDTETLSKLVLKGDLTGLTPTETMDYYYRFCEHLGLDPLTRPFDILQLGGKRVLYAHKGCTDQLRRKYGVSITDLKGEVIQDAYRVTAIGHDNTGRSDAATGVVRVKGLEGDAFANAVMKSETKAKRRLTLSLCGLGMLDETEVETIPGAVPISVDFQTTEKKEEPVYDVGSTPEESMKIPVAPPIPVVDQKKVIDEKRAWLKSRYLKLCRSKWLTEEDKITMKFKMKTADRDLNKIQQLVKEYEGVAESTSKAVSDEEYKKWKEELEAGYDTGDFDP